MDGRETWHGAWILPRLTVPLTVPLVPQWGWDLCYGVKSLITYQTVTGYHTHTHNSLGIYCNKFGDPAAFYLVPSWKFPFSLFLGVRPTVYTFYMWLYLYSLCSVRFYTKKHGSLPAGAALLHHLGPVVPRQLAETIIAVDNGPVHDLSISQHKVGIWLRVRGQMTSEINTEHRIQTLSSEFEKEKEKRGRLHLIWIKDKGFGWSYSNTDRPQKQMLVEVEQIKKLNV